LPFQNSIKRGYFMQAKKSKQHYCRICGLKINQGHYCMDHRKNYLHDYYVSSAARYERLKKSIKRISQLMQVAPAMEWEINETKLKARIDKLQAKLQEMEKLNPELKTEPGKEN